MPAAAPFDPTYAAIAQGEAISIVEVSLLERAGAREPCVDRAVEAMLGDARRLGWV